MAEKRKPWIKWFTRDWRSNAKLRMCSYGARGLWADMISLMAEAEQFGFLIINGVIPTCRQLSGLLGGTEKEVAKLRAELGAANVFSVTGEAMPEDIRELIPPDMPDGVIFSRRMVRDAAKAERDRQNGKGGGNPNLLGSDKGSPNASDIPPDKPPVNRGVNPPANPQSQSQNQSSEAKASAAMDRSGERFAASADDPKAVLFGPAVRAFVGSATGKPAKAVGALIGKWCRDFDKDYAALLVELSAAQDDPPGNLVEWMGGVVRRRKSDAPAQTYEQAIAQRARDPAWDNVL